MWDALKKPMEVERLNEHEEGGFTNKTHRKGMPQTNSTTGGGCAKQTAGWGCPTTLKEVGCPKLCP